jgi:hypothetical protein
MADPVRLPISAGRSDKEGTGAVPHSSSFDGGASLTNGSFRHLGAESAPLYKTESLVNQIYRDGIAPITYGSESVSGIQ